MSWIITGAAVFLAGAALDFYTSKRAFVDLPGYREGNPVVAWFLRFGGTRTVLATLKLGTGIVIPIVGVYWGEWDYATVGQVLLALGVIQLTVGYLNLKRLRNRRK